ncbi:PorV/PorQ family protein [candidate division KSB1 bacterium]|nr:PorV/PorQ family protein [candidate division KSB1 bacterium]
MPYSYQNILKTISLLFILTLSNAAEAGQEYHSAGAFLNLGVDTRALAMGSAFTSLSTGPEAVYWNPAGLSLCRRVKFSTMISQLTLDRKHNWASIAYPWDFVGTLAVGWVGYSVSDIEGRTQNTPDPEWTFSDAQNALMLSFGREFVDFFFAGITAKLLHHNLDGYVGYGAGFDAGFLFAPGRRRLRIGVVFQNLNAQWQWQNQHREILPLILRAGASFQMGKNFIVAADINHSHVHFHDPRFGIEYRFMGLFPLRVGFDNNQPTAGLGLKIYAEKANVTFDYALARDSFELKEMHRLSVSFELNPKWRPQQTQR